MYRSKDLNEALEREPYYSRTVDELISMFTGAKVFTIVDMDKVYWQVELHPDSNKYIYMAFDIGRYQFETIQYSTLIYCFSSPDTPDTLSYKGALNCS